MHRVVAVQNHLPLAVDDLFEVQDPAVRGVGDESENLAFALHGAETKVAVMFEMGKMHRAALVYADSGSWPVGWLPPGRGLRRVVLAFDAPG
jgi:hypothetical protein